MSGTPSGSSHSPVASRKDRAWRFLEVYTSFSTFSFRLDTILVRGAQCQYTRDVYRSKTTSYMTSLETVATSRALYRIWFRNHSQAVRTRSRTVSFWGLMAVECGSIALASWCCAGSGFPHIHRRSKRLMTGAPTLPQDRSGLYIPRLHLQPVFVPSPRMRHY